MNNEYIYGIYSIIEHFLFLNYTKFGFGFEFELINQKMFEMKI
jgi:hypothetical protein